MSNSSVKSQKLRSPFINAADGKTYTEKCAICRMCELICSLRHYNVSNPRRSRITIEFDEHGSIKQQVSLQCPTHPCVDACPRGALLLDRALQIYTVDPDRCDGCQGLPDPLVRKSLKKFLLLFRGAIHGNLNNKRSVEGYLYELDCL